MEDLQIGIKTLRTNRAACLDDMLCEHINTFWSSNSFLRTTDDEQYIEVQQIHKAMEEIESDNHPKTRKKYSALPKATYQFAVPYLQDVRTNDS